MTTEIRKSPKATLLGLLAVLALMLGLAGAGLAATDSAYAQSPSPTSDDADDDDDDGTTTPTATSDDADDDDDDNGATTTRTTTAVASPPQTGSGLTSSEGGSSLALPIAALAVIMIGGGVAFAIASRNQE